jgi:hypothetical protein
LEEQEDQVAAALDRLRIKQEQMVHQYKEARLRSRWLFWRADGTLQPTIAQDQFCRSIEELCQRLESIEQGEPLRNLRKAVSWIKTTPSDYPELDAFDVQQEILAEILSAQSQFLLNVAERQRERARQRLDHLIEDLRGIYREQLDILDDIETGQRKLITAGSWTRALAVALALSLEAQEEVISQLDATIFGARELPFVHSALTTIGREMRDSLAVGKAYGAQTSLPVAGDDSDQWRADLRRQEQHLRAAIRRLRDLLEVLETQRVGLSEADSVGPTDRRPTSLFRPERVPAIRLRGLAGARGVEKDPWGHLPLQMRRELEQYQRDRFLPKYEDECVRYYRSLMETEDPRKD